VSVPRPNLSAAHGRTGLAIASRLCVAVCASSFSLTAEIDRLFGARVIYGRPIKRDFGRVPYIDDWLRQAVRRAPSRFVCLIKAGILLSAAWLARKAGLSGDRRCAYRRDRPED
jgi:hypothetical protein